MTALEERAGPLSGLRVLDFARVLAGPYCALLLANLGADVVKVERPESGDDTRAWGPPFAGGESAYYLSVNNSKRSITLDLSTRRGQDVARALALRCDVLIENFRAGAMEEWGLGYDSLCAEHPRLIYCAISGFSRTGPRRDLPGYDFLAQALGGIMSVTGAPEGEPTKVGVAIVDITAGLYAGMGILSALHARTQTGRGQRVDVNLLDSAAGWLANVASNYLVSGQAPRRHGNAHPNIVPYQLFHALDGPLILAVGNDSQWRRLCESAGWLDLSADPRFATNEGRVAFREELVHLLAARLIAQPVDVWVALCHAAGVPVGRVNTVDQVFEDPGLLSAGMVTSVPHPTAGTVRVVGVPIHLSETPVAVYGAPPLLGQHTAAVLGDWLGVEWPAASDL